MPQHLTMMVIPDLCWFRSEIHSLQKLQLGYIFSKPCNQAIQHGQIGHTSLARAYARDMICVCKRGLLGPRCTPLTPGTERCLSRHPFQPAYFTFTVCQKSRDCILIIKQNSGMERGMTGTVKVPSAIPGTHIINGCGKMCAFAPSPALFTSHISKSSLSQ